MLTDLRVTPRRNSEPLNMETVGLGSGLSVRCAAGRSSLPTCETLFLELTWCAQCAGTLNLLSSCTGVCDGDTASVEVRCGSPVRRYIGGAGERPALAILATSMFHSPLIDCKRRLSSSLMKPTWREKPQLPSLPMAAACLRGTAPRPLAALSTVVSMFHPGPCQSALRAGEPGPISFYSSDCRAFQIIFHSKKSFPRGAAHGKERGAALCGAARGGFVGGKLLWLCCCVE